MNIMKMTELLRPYNKQYKAIFGYIPVPTEYAGTLEEYSDALKRSVKTRQPIDTYLTKLIKPSDPNALT